MTQTVQRVPTTTPPVQVDLPIEPKTCPTCGEPSPVGTKNWYHEECAPADIAERRKRKTEQLRAYRETHPTVARDSMREHNRRKKLVLERAAKR